MAAFGPQAIGQSQQPALTLKEVLQLVKHNKGDTSTLTATLMERGVDFDLTPKIAEKLRKAGADDQSLAAIWRATPVGRMTPAALFTSASGAEIRTRADSPTTTKTCLSSKTRILARASM